jgi:hypothetical protein
VYSLSASYLSSHSPVQPEEAKQASLRMHDAGKGTFPLYYYETREESMLDRTTDLFLAGCYCVVSCVAPTQLICLATSVSSSADNVNMFQTNVNVVKMLFFLRNHT